MAADTTAPRVKPSSVAEEEESDRDRVVRQANELFETMRSQPFTARMTGCGGWDCDDATLHIQLPGRLRIVYDYDSTVLADGQTLYSYRGQSEVARSLLAETDLSCLLAGELGDGVSVDAVQEIDRGPESGAPRRVWRVDVSRGDHRLTLLFAREPFRFIGWIAPGAREDFSAEIRDLRPEPRPAADLFAPFGSNERTL